MPLDCKKSVWCYDSPAGMAAVNLHSVVTRDSNVLVKSHVELIKIPSSKEASPTPIRKKCYLSLGVATPPYWRG